jgi:hypothetical protein
MGPKRHSLIRQFYLWQDIAVATRSKARTVLYRSNIWMIYSNPTRGLDLSVCLSVCPSIHPSIHLCLSVCLSICLGFYSRLLNIGRSSVSWSFKKSAGLLGRGISPSQGFCLHTGPHTHRINAQTSMPQVEFDPPIPVFARAKTVHALDQRFSTAGPRPGTGPSSHKERIYRAAVSQRLRTTAWHCAATVIEGMDICCSWFCLCCRVPVGFLWLADPTSKEPH